MKTVTPVTILERKKDFLKQLNNFKIDEKLANDFENIISNFKINRIISFCSGSCKVEY